MAYRVESLGFRDPGAGLGSGLLLSTPSFQVLVRSTGEGPLTVRTSPRISFLRG